MSVSTDPILDSLDALNDRSKFECVRGVPVFKPHKRYQRYDADGRLLPQDEWELLYEVKEPDLDDIARACRELEERHGVLARLTDGHIRPGEPQSAQPALIGYAKNPRVGRWGPENEPAVLYDWYIRKDQAEIARHRPFRSVEYRPSRKTITGIGLLLTDPELDLGTLILARAPEPVYFYSRQEAPLMADDSKDKKPPEKEKPANDKPDKVKSAEDGHGEDLAPKTGLPMEVDGEEHYAKMVPHLHRFMSQHFPHLARIHAEHAQRYEAGAAGAGAAPTGPGAPCGTNVQPPEMAGTTPGEENALPMNRDPKEQLALYEREHRDLKAQNAALKERLDKIERDRDMALYEADLSKLHHDFVFDMDKAKKRAAGMSAAQFGDYKADIIENYEKRPSAVPAAAVGRASPSGQAQRLTQDGVRAAKRLAREKGITFDAALTELAGSTNGGTH